MGLTDYSRMDKEFYLAGIRAENERIIKLLEAMDCGDETCIHDQCCFSEDTIALIKGEK